MAEADHIYAVILAGGSGTRFWPRSRHLTPKQLCRIGDPERTMIEITLDRLDGFIPPERRIIVTHKDQLEATRAIAGDACPCILGEPEARNTANALAMAALEIRHRHGGDRVMISLHADHVIRDEDRFRDALRSGVRLARAGYLGLLGIRPSAPETGFGYIEKGGAVEGLNDLFHVRAFREKPDAETAVDLVRSGDNFWNAGIFTWKVDTILQELEMRLPQCVNALNDLLQNRTGFDEVPAADLASAYGRLPKISIDHAVLEVSENVAMVEGGEEIGWRDVGSWDALTTCFASDEQGNLLTGDVLALDTTGTTVDTDKTFVACLGLKNMVVVSAANAVLVCPRDRAQDVKKIVETLKERGRTDLL